MGAIKKVVGRFCLAFGDAMEAPMFEAADVLGAGVRVEIVAKRDVGSFVLQVHVFYFYEGAVEVEGGS